MAQVVMMASVQHWCNVGSKARMAIMGGGQVLVS